jgi:cytochrome d ubiquinol oxidase subunit II
VASIALHIPITILLIGIVLRGSAFVFRQYGDGDPGRELLWSRVFAGASIVSPLFLGIIVGAVTSGDIRVVDGVPTTGYLAGWIGLFPLAVGLFTVSLFAFLAATYLTVEAKDRELQGDFRRRALCAGIAVAPCALLAALTAHGPGSAHFAEAFLRSPWTWPLQLATGAAAIGALAALYLRRFPLARVLAVAQTTLILLGWALSQRPYLIAPDVTIQNAASPEATLGPMLVIVAAGALLLIPSLYVLFRIFKKA